MNFEFIFVQDTDLCIRSMSVSVISLMKNLGAPKSWTDQCDS